MQKLFRSWKNKLLKQKKTLWITFQRLEKQTSRSPKNQPLEVCKKDTNKTKFNNTEYSDTYLISSADSDAGLDEYTAYAEIIRDNLDWKILCDRYPYDRELLEGIYDLILETVLCKSGSVLIARNEYPVQLVKSKFLKLHSGHVKYVVDCLKGIPQRFAISRNIC